MRFILCVLWCCVWWNSPVTSFKKKLIGLGEPNSPENGKEINIEDKWFVQKLNHFDPSDNRTWKQVFKFKTK